MFFLFLLLGMLVIFFSTTAGWLLANPVRSEKRFLLILFCFAIAFFSFALNNILMIRNNAKKLEVWINPQKNQSPVALVEEK